MFQDSVSSFHGSGVKVTSDGRPYLGAAIGSEGYIQSFISGKVKGWSEEITVLARFAEISPMLLTVLLHMVCQAVGYCPL